MEKTIRSDWIKLDPVNNCLEKVYYSILKTVVWTKKAIWKPFYNWYWLICQLQRQWETAWMYRVVILNGPPFGLRQLCNWQSSLNGVLHLVFN